MGKLFLKDNIITRYLLKKIISLFVMRCLITFIHYFISLQVISFFNKCDKLILKNDFSPILAFS